MGRYKKKPIKVLLFRGYETNKNTASYNRNEAIEKMLNNVFHCTVIKQHAEKTNVKNKYIRGIKNKILLYWLLRKIYSLSKEKSYFYVIFLRSIDPLASLLAWMISMTIGAKLAIERNEFPSVYTNNRNKIRMLFYKIFILPWHYRLFDVVFVMTDELMQFYGKHVRKKNYIQKLPMTVDFERFKSNESYSGKPYIFYAGSLFEKKDGVESLIKAFKKIYQKHSDLELIIAGSSKNGVQEKKLENLINNLALSHRINLLGSVSRDDIPKYITSAKILVMPRPDSLQAKGGFPTKLGEYLASGKPVIVTRVGEIPVQLSDDQVFFISPDNIIEELVDKVNFIMHNYDLALLIGLRGKQAAYRKFGLSANQIYLKEGFETVFSKKP